MDIVRAFVLVVPATGVCSSASARLQTSLMPATSSSSLPSMSSPTPIMLDEHQRAWKARLKNELMRHAVVEYSPQKSDAIERIMMLLEPLNETEVTATSEFMMGSWYFVFSGTLTPGMFLIQLLQTISKTMPGLKIDLEDVRLVIAADAQDFPFVTCEVRTRFWGSPIDLEIYSQLIPTGSSSVELDEHFRGLSLGGRSVPLPKSMYNSRLLVISYLDEEIMIARTAGGPPHLLVRDASKKHVPPASSQDEVFTLRDSGGKARTSSLIKVGACQVPGVALAMQSREGASCEFEAAPSSHPEYINSQPLVSGDFQ